MNTPEFLNDDSYMDDEDAYEQACEQFSAWNETGGFAPWHWEQTRFQVVKMEGTDSDDAAFNFTIRDIDTNEVRVLKNAIHLDMKTFTEEDFQLCELI